MIPVILFECKGLFPYIFTVFSQKQIHTKISTREKKNKNHMALKLVITPQNIY